jgi:hypothetical protein
MTASDALEPTPNPSYRRRYVFDRYRDGQLMAEGGSVFAHDEREALGNVSRLFGERNSSFKLIRVEEHTGVGEHHDIIAARRGVPAQIKSRVAALHESGAIDEAEYAACQRFHRDWDVGMEGAAPGGMRVRVDADSGGSALDRRIDAMSRVRAVRDRFTADLFVLLVFVIPIDMPWARIGAQYGVSDVTARKRGVAAVKLLAEVYAIIDAGKARRLS